MKLKRQPQKGKYHDYINQLESKEKQGVYRILLVAVLLASLSTGIYFTFWGFRGTFYSTVDANTETNTPFRHQIEQPTENLPPGQTVKEIQHREPEAETFIAENKAEAGHKVPATYAPAYRPPTSSPGGKPAAPKRERPATKVKVEKPLSQSQKSSTTKRGNTQKKEENQQATPHTPPSFSGSEAHSAEEEAPRDLPPLPGMLPPTAEKAETNNSSTSGKEKKAFSKPLQIADKMPQFPGGNTAMYAYLNRRLQYPQVAKDYGVEGRVFVQFVVQPDGSLSNVKVVRGIGYGCDQEALRIVKKMPRWIPGEHQGVKAPVIYTIHVQFNLK